MPTRRPAPAPTGRVAHHPVDPLFLERWSPRAFDESVMPDADLMTIFEAARWAPSAFNTQPWRFLYAKRESADWPRFLDLLVPFNQAWAKHASVLVFILSDTMMEVKAGEPTPSHTHSFDAGAAWAAMALQAARLGYISHGMAGVDWDRAREALHMPERFRLEAAAVFGTAGDPAKLDERLRAREVPSGRRKIAEFAFAGDFPAPPASEADPA